MLQKHGIANTRIDQRKGICGKMKKQLIIGQRRKSAGFAERHEMEEQEKKVRRMEEQDG